MDDLARLGLQNVDVAFRCAGDDVVAENREDGRGRGLLVLGSGDAVAQWCGWQDPLGWFRVGDVDQVWAVLEQRCDEKIVVVGVQFGRVDWCFELYGA